MLKIIIPDFIFDDERGSIIQLIREGYSQINVITSKKGVSRGGHYHTENEEAFYVITGKLEVTVNGTTHSFSNGDFFGIDRGDVHSFLFLEDTTLVSMYSKGVEISEGIKDIYVAKGD